MRSHIRRLLESAGFSPRQLFAALQGAWLEPRSGLIWQENTGITPTTTGGQTIGRIADLSGYGNVATQATAANRPTLQFNGALPLARFDTTDFLSLSLPAINVRRNLLTWSEQFDNGVWTRLNITTITKTYDPDLNSEVTIFNSAAEQQITRILTKVSQQITYTLSVLMERGTTYVQVGCGDAQTGSGYANYNTVTGSRTATGQSGEMTFVSSSFTPVANTWCVITLTVLSSARNTLSAYVFGWGGGAIKYMQLELGSVATPYQKITDWTSEAFASSGSVYFSTPVGMSQLNNQSMGTTFSLPAISSDIYAWCVFPSRLNAAQENRLRLYMLKKAELLVEDQLSDVNGDLLSADDGETVLLSA